MMLLLLRSSCVEDGGDVFLMNASCDVDSGLLGMADAVGIIAQQLGCERGVAVRVVCCAVVRCAASVGILKHFHLEHQHQTALLMIDDGMVDGDG
eukprot:scaffold36296_cov115-Cyclotella_meneghiniana.AAC.13